MINTRASITVLMLLFNLCASAKEVTDTLYSAYKDRIIVSYSITQKGSKVDLQFNSIRKLLGGYHYGKYKKEADRIHTLFFDQIMGGKEQGIQFKGEVTPTVICLPARASYKKSSDGYFVVEQRPTLSFELESSESKTFTIPLYLAHYEKKQLYKILCSCGNLEVHIPNILAQSSSTRPGNEKPSRQSSNEFVEIGEEIDEFDTEALNLVGLIKEELPRQNTWPMDKTLEKKIDRLNELQAKIKKEDIVKKISETLDECNNKEKELKKGVDESNKQKADDDDFIICTSKVDYERYLKQHPNGSHVEEAKAEIAKIDDKAKEEKDKENKRTIWMIVGGALLAILLFVGNQVLQSVRNIRTQRSMMQMQQDATNRAKNMARSKARGEIRKQTNKVTGQVRKKSQTIIRGTTDKVKNNKGNNRVSI